MQDTASKLEALELNVSNSIEKKRSASLLLPYNNGKKNKNKKTLLLFFYWPLKRERYPVKRLRATLEKRKKEA